MKVATVLLAVAMAVLTVPAIKADDLSPGEPVVITGTVSDDGGAVNVSLNSLSSAIPVSEFDTSDKDDQAIRRNSSEINALKTEVAQNSRDIEETQLRVDDLKLRIDKVDEEASQGTALLSAVDFQRPLEGKKFRLGLGTGAYNGESAFGVSLTTVVGQFDLSIGGAASGGDALGKAAVGYSW
jgi:hypothetical protein